jgi:hypothetical protein
VHCTWTFSFCTSLIIVILCVKNICGRDHKTVSCIIYTILKTHLPHSHTHTLNLTLVTPLKMGTGYRDAQGADFDSSSKSEVSAAGNQTEIYKVAVRVPPFWPEEPEIWFAQIEGQFAISGITSDATKFNYIISQLDNKYSREVKDIIINPK